VLPKLTRVDFDSGVVGRAIEKVEAQGKWLRMDFSGDLILLTHMPMSGSWHIYRPEEKWQRRPIDIRVVLKTEKIWAVAFNVPIAEFHTADTLRRREGFRKLGQDVLGAEFDPAQSIASLQANGDLEIGGRSSRRWYSKWRLTIFRNPAGMKADMRCSFRESCEFARISR
jgi:endonuclease-8